ncbi:DUF3889 domain-containing protein [Paenibacillus sp. LMG 31461]|uniref:DUF3889 domain-containing protein n=1 Tax=Paenibacillus plantarum TaxID=2654975 RepID=A0ABX1XBS9_9BACL|nr:DUF3889 domain-containing protein [Paenibacillus plantarum]NOU65923.1 DUF3889 domain-containing protein [Paenibacillus plantarum]
MFGLSWVGSSSALAVDANQHGNSGQIVSAPIQDPSYAKWSRLAFHEAGKVYTLLDYKYIGKSNVAPGVVQQQFRFWVKKNGAEFPLIVSIRYDPVTEKVFTILMEQENRGTLRIL